MKKTPSPLNTLLPALLLAFCLRAEEPTQLPTLQVQAGRTETRQPTFAAAATTFDRSALRTREAHHLQDALGMVPNLTTAGATSRPRYLQIRGIGERSQFAGEGPPNFSVGVLFDEIDLSGLAGAASLFDVQQLSVLRGPQATAYGSKALAGLLLLRSEPPSPQTSSRLQLSAGSDDFAELGVATGGPWSPNSDTLSYRLTLHTLRQNGFRTNEFLDRDTTNRRLELHSRLQFLYEPAPDQRHEITLLGARLDNGYDAFAPRGDGFTTYTDEPGNDALSLLGGSLRSTWLHPNAFDLLSITSATRATSEYSYDADWGNDAFWAAPPYLFNPDTEGFRNQFTERLDRTRNQASQEFRLLGKPDARLFNNRSAWSLGLALSWLEERDDYTGFSSLRSDYQAHTQAGYAQLTTDLNPALQLITSLRLEHRASDYSDDQSTRFDTSDWMTGGRIALEAALSDTTHTFLGLGRGFKGGGVNANPNLTADQRAYDPETVWNLETGITTRWADGRGSAALTLFHMWRRDLQIGTSIQPNPADPTTFTFFTDNAAEGTNTGLELELLHPLTSALTLFGSLGLLETEYKNFRDAGGNLNVDGREQPHAPSYTFRAGASLDLSPRWFARAELEGADQFYFSDSHNQTSSPYELLHLSLGYRAETWSLTLWGRNVLDTAYATRGYFFGLEPPDYPSRLWTTQGDPAQFGLTCRLEF